MEITDVRMRLRDSSTRMKAVVSITIDNEFVVHDIKIIEGFNKNLFIAMPSRKASEGDYKDIAHPITPQTREKIEKIILDVYYSLKEEQGQAEEDNDDSVVEIDGISTDLSYE